MTEEMGNFQAYSSPQQTTTVAAALSDFPITDSAVVTLTTVTDSINFTETERQSIVPYSSLPLTVAQIFWVYAFMSMLSVAIIGNIIVIWIVLAHRRMRTVTNYFLLNLSIADLTMASFNGVPNFFYMLKRDWLFGSVLCVVNNFVANFTVASCVFTMTAISIDRYLAIIRPLQPRMTKKSAWKAIMAIWICSAILASPCLYYSTNPVSPNGQSNCFLEWPDGGPGESQRDFIYNVCLLIITYILPMIAMAFCYGAMSVELWGNRQIGETQRQINSMASKRKVVRMFICLVTSFAIFWFPYHAYFIYTYVDSSLLYKDWSQHLYLSFFFLAMSTSMINPVLYYFMMTRFRGYIHGIFLKCCFLKCCIVRNTSNESQFQQQEAPPLCRRCSHSYSRSRSRSGTQDDTNYPQTPGMNNHHQNHHYQQMMVRSTRSGGGGGNGENCTGGNGNGNRVRTSSNFNASSYRNSHRNQVPMTCNTYC